MRTKGEVVELLVEPGFNRSGVAGQSGLEQVAILHVHFIPAYLGNDDGAIVCFLLVQCDGRSILPIGLVGSTGITWAVRLARWGSARGPTLSPLPNLI